MVKVNPWGVLDLKSEHFVITIQGRVLTWHYAPPERVQNVKSESSNQERYADYSDALKLHCRTKRKRRKLSKQLFSLIWRPCWLISYVYPYDQALNLSQNQLRFALDYLGNRFRGYYNKGYAFYQIDYSDKSRFHLHLLARCGKYPSRKNRIKIKYKAREWWETCVGSDASQLVKVQHLPTELDSNGACSYLVRGDKLDDHIRVTDFMGKRYTFGCFNAKNLRAAPVKRYEVPVDDFPDIRKVICFDVHEDSKRSSGSYLSDHENKILHAGSGFHIISDSNLEKKIRQKLIKLSRQVQGGK